VTLTSEMGGRLPGDPVEIGRRSRTDVRKVRHDVLWFPTFFTWDDSAKCWRSERLERQAAKYQRKVVVARINGNESDPEMGDGHDHDTDSGHDPEMGAENYPEMGDITPVSQTQTQTLKEITTPTPSGSGGESKGKGKGSRKPRTPKPEATNVDPFVAYSLEVSTATNEVAKCTPAEDRDGRLITVDPGKVAQRITQILKDHPKLDGTILVEAWKMYLARKPKQTKAPQYYFGKQENQSNGEGANWLPDAILLWHVRQKQATTPPPGPEPTIESA